MRIDTVSAQLLGARMPNLGSGASRAGAAGEGLAVLAGRLAAARSGVEAGNASAFKPVWRFEARTREESRFEARDVVETRDVLAAEAVEEERQVLATRDVVEERARFVSRDVTAERTRYVSRDVTEERTVYASRDIVETRDVFEERDVMGARVTGTKSLAGKNNLYAAGISTGSGVSVETADGKVEVKFDNYNSLTVKTDDRTIKLSFNALDGSYKQALASALNGSGVVSAAWTADGKLELAADEAIRVKAVGGNSTLSALGLAAGRTEVGVVGTERVKVGTQQVVVGAERVAVGTETVVVGQEAVADGTEMVVVGTETVADGIERVVTGTEQYVAGTERVVVGSRTVKVGEERVVVGTEEVKVGTETVADGVERRLVGLDRLAAVPSLWSGADGLAAKPPTSIVDVIAGAVAFRDRLFSEGESRAGYNFALGLEEPEGGPVGAAPQPRAAGHAWSRPVGGRDDA